MAMQILSRRETGTPPERGVQSEAHCRPALSIRQRYSTRLPSAAPIVGHAESSEVIRDSRESYLYSYACIYIYIYLCVLFKFKTLNIEEATGFVRR